MVCPMAKKPQAPAEVGTEYPYESLYRPWSWIFSSLFNVFLFAALLGICYFLYRTRKSRKARNSVTYRTVQMQKAASGEGVEGPGGRVKALVTGGNGSLGAELVRTLVADGHYSVYSLDLLLPEEEARDQAVHTYIQADITNLDDLLVAFRGMEVVFHTAGLTPMSLRHTPNDYRSVNVGGTENVLEACRTCGVKRLIHTSSSSVVVSADPKLTCVDSDESSPLPDKPLNAYVATKGQADQMVREASGGDLLTCVLRPGAFVEANYAGIADSLFIPTGGGDFEYSVVPLESVARAHLLAEKKLSDQTSSSTVAGKAYNIGDESLSIPDLVRFIASETKSSPLSVPFSVVKLLAYANEALYRLTGLVAINESLSSISVGYKTHTFVCQRAREELGWESPAPWRDMVRRLIKKKAEEGTKKGN